MTLGDIREEMEFLQREVSDWKNDGNKAWLLDMSIRVLGLIKVEERKEEK